MNSVLALHPAAPGQILGVPKIFLMMLRFIDITAQNSGQRLDNVNQTQLELASGTQYSKKIWHSSKSKNETDYLALKVLGGHQGSDAVDGADNVTNHNFERQVYECLWLPR